MACSFSACEKFLISMCKGGSIVITEKYYGLFGCIERNTGNIISWWKVIMLIIPARIGDALRN